MTDFEKIKSYYDKFDEKNRLNKDASGKFEFEMTMKILDKYLPKDSTILDLGGGAGVYTFPLAKIGHKVYLSDLSEKLIEQAKEEKMNQNITNVISCDVVNAIDLSIYEDNKFDVVILFGPLYHLTSNEERIKCVKEVKRVLKPNGIVFASFIPYLAGSIAIIDRYLRHPEQVTTENLEKVFDNGAFNNASNNGFQEGAYLAITQINNLFDDFEKLELRSIRGFGYEKEEQLYSIQDKTMYNKIIELIDKTSELNEIIETCGHAIFIGKKK